MLSPLREKIALSSKKSDPEWQSKMGNLAKSGGGLHEKKKIAFVSLFAPLSVPIDLLSAEINSVHMNTIYQDQSSSNLVHILPK